MNFNELMETNRSFKRGYLKKISTLDEQELDIISAGFNNSVRWNVAHIITSNLLLTYDKYGMKLPFVSPDFISQTRKGTRPDNIDKTDEFSIRNLLDVLERVRHVIKKDWNELNSHSYGGFTTSKGFVISNIFQTMCFSQFHDGVHFGIIDSMIKTLRT